MTKRADGKFARRGGDHYPTPAAAVCPLLPYLPAATRFIEPCHGQQLGGFNELVPTLEWAGHRCVARSGPERPAETTRYDCDAADCFITNPPWRRGILHPIIDNLSAQLPTWLLFDADWMHTRQSIPYLDRLALIVSVGRVRWIAESPSVGFDNVCWYLFTARDAFPEWPCKGTLFQGRRESF